MLVLSRKSQESVVVAATKGDELLLKVTVLDIQGGELNLASRSMPKSPCIAGRFGNAFSRTARQLTLRTRCERQRTLCSRCFTDSKGFSHRGYL